MELNTIIYLSISLVLVLSLTIFVPSYIISRARKTRLELQNLEKTSNNEGKNENVLKPQNHLGSKKYFKTNFEDALKLKNSKKHKTDIQSEKPKFNGKSLSSVERMTRIRNLTVIDNNKRSSDSNKFNFRKTD